MLPLFWDLNALGQSAWAALGLLMLRVALAPLLVQQLQGRSEARLLAFYLLLGSGAGFALGLVRREKLAWAFALAGLAGGLGAWALDYFYNYESLVYRGVWWLIYLVVKPSQAVGAHAPYGVLQALRFLAPALALACASFWFSSKARPSLWRSLPCLALALAFIYFLRGAMLLAYFKPEFGSHGTLVFSAYFLLFYGLAPVDRDRAK